MGKTKKSDQEEKNQSNGDSSNDSKITDSDKSEETNEVKPQETQKPPRKVENEIRNYGSDSCGAKIIEYSHGENAKALLDSNQDVYLKAKCDALPLRFVI